MILRTSRIKRLCASLALFGALA
ncbi:MAG: hypothetical protein K0S97_2274, partial [Chloroflexota bacterium]|nr:hypothetical protein [Chloroflexota bacterium]